MADKVSTNKAHMASCESQLSCCCFIFSICVFYIVVFSVHVFFCFVLFFFFSMSLCLPSLCVFVFFSLFTLVVSYVSHIHNNISIYTYYKYVRMICVYEYNLDSCSSVWCAEIFLNEYEWCAE